MSIKELIEIIKYEKHQRDVENNNRKRNINSNYIIAKQDFKVIDNLNDSINTLTNILYELEDLQERIIKRNK